MRSHSICGVLRAAGTVVLVTSLAVFVLVGIAPRTGRFQVFTVLTASMQPTIPAGSAVVVTRWDAASLRVGDVITYRIPVQDRRVVTHRVVRIEQKDGRPTVWTKGDALEDVDQWSTRFAGGPVWKVRAHAVGVGHVLRAVQAPVTRKVVVWGLPALLALAWLIEIWGAGAHAAVARRLDERDLIVIGPGLR